MPATFDIVLFSFNDFTGRLGRAHHMAGLLARRHRVFYVDPPTSVLGRAPVRVRVWRAGEHLVHIRLPGGLPGRQWRWIHQLNQRRWLGMLQRCLTRHNWGEFNQPVCVHMTPVWDAAVERLTPHLSVYDAHDDWRSIRPNRPKLIERLEAEHADTADIILSSSTGTAENFAGTHRRTHELPNACDPAHFGRAMTDPPADDLADIPRPRVMYVGGLGDCLATEAIVGTARRMPRVSFVFVGPEETSQRALRAEPNIHLLGERPYEQLPAYLAGADMCWLPFALTPHALGRDCIKLYEYLATGKPVVSTPLPRAQKLTDGIMLAEPSGDALAAACRGALTDVSPVSREDRLAVARQHTWQGRVAELERLLEMATAPPKHTPPEVLPTSRALTLADLPPAPEGTWRWPWVVDSETAVARQKAASATAPADDLPTITLVTPTLNQCDYLEEAIRSVLAQGYPRLQYIVVDGDSTDGTLAIIDKYAPFLADWASEADRGQSDAINKGLSWGTGEVFGWLCSDDILTPGALLTVGTYFANHPGCRWLAGAGDFRNVDTRHVTHCTAGLDGEMALLDYWRYGMAGHYIPQPSCFWRRDLWETVGGVRVRSHLAMDFELWLEFQQQAALHTIDRTLSVSKVHAQAKSSRFRPEQYVDMRRLAFREARRRHIHPSVLVGRKAVWTVAWRLARLGKRLVGKTGPGRG
ncbi:MAG: glycosyltransferase [Planctomycetota bacterium]